LLDERDGPLPALLMAFTLLAGVVDATSILALDHVFVATITGNIVFLGLGLLGLAGFSATSAMVAVAGFVFGVFPGDRLCRLSSGHRGRAVRNVAAMKAVLAVPVTLIVLLAPDPLPTGVRLVVTALLAASFGGQLALVRYLKVADLMTAAMTMTTIGLLTERGPTRRVPVLLRRVLGIASFLLGVVIGGSLVAYVAPAAALAFGLLIILAVGVGSHVVSRNEAAWASPR
jgi:uncharacterized membrane protein YoaK (UPF0700 family)